MVIALQTGRSPPMQTQQDCSVVIHDLIEPSAACMIVLCPKQLGVPNRASWNVLNGDYWPRSFHHSSVVCQL